MAQVIKKIKVGDDTNPVEQAFYLSTSTGASDGTGLGTVAGSGTSGAYKSVRWYIKDVAGITAPYDGMRVAIKVPLNGVSTAGVILSINGNTDADYHPVAYNINTVLTSHFPQNTVKVFTYDASQTMTCYKTSNTAVTVTGVWKADANYDSNTTVTYGTLEYYFRPYNGANALYRYKFCALDKDNRIVPLTTTEVANGTAVTNITPTSVAFRPDKIWWYCTTTTIAASALLGGQTLWRSGYNANNATSGGMAVCNFNETITTYKLIYLCGTYNKTTGLFTLRDGGTASSTNYYKLVPTNTANITLSSYFTSGYDYILLGGTYSSNNYIQLFEQNPMYHFDGTNLVPYDTWNTAQASSNQTVKGNGTAFGANAAIDVVGGGNVTVTGDATNNKITVSYTTPASLPANGGTASKVANKLDIYGETTKVLEFDGSAGKSLYIKASTTAGAFTVSDGTSSKLVQLAGSFTDTTYGAQSGITLANSKYGHANTAITAGTTQSVYSIKYDSYGHITAATAVTIPTDTNQKVKTSNVTFGNDDVIEIKAGDNVTVTGDATSKTITIAATAPAATGYAGTLALSANSYSNGTQSVSALYANNVYASSAIWLSPNDCIYSDTEDNDGIHIAQFSADGRYLSLDYSYINFNTGGGNVTINASNTGIYGSLSTYNIKPGTNNSYDIGSSNYKYNYIYGNYLGTANYPVYSAYISSVATSFISSTRILLSANGTTYGSICLTASTYISINAGTSISLYAGNGSQVSIRAGGNMYLVPNAGSSLYIASNINYYSQIYIGPGSLGFSSYYQPGIYLDSTGAMQSCPVNTIACFGNSTITVAGGYIAGYSTYNTNNGNVANTASSWTSWGNAFYWNAVFTRMSSTSGVVNMTIKTAKTDNDDVYVRLNLSWLLNRFNRTTSTYINGKFLITGVATTNGIGATVTGFKSTAYGSGPIYIAFVSSHSGITTSTSTGTYGWLGTAYYLYVARDWNNGGNGSGWTANVTIPVTCTY